MHTHFASLMTRAAATAILLIGTLFVGSCSDSNSPSDSITISEQYAENLLRSQHPQFYNSLSSLQPGNTLVSMLGYIVFPEDRWFKDEDLGLTTIGYALVKSYHEAPLFLFSLSYSLSSGNTSFVGVPFFFFVMDREIAPRGYRLEPIQVYDALGQSNNLPEIAKEYWKSLPQTITTTSTYYFDRNRTSILEDPYTFNAGNSPRRQGVWVLARQ